jgi:putative transposase
VILLQQCGASTLENQSPYFCRVSVLRQRCKVIAESDNKRAAVTAASPCTIRGRRVTRVLDEVTAQRGILQAIRRGKHPELTSRHFLARSLEEKIKLHYIEPRRPMPDGYVESFQGRLREECLRANWFRNIFDAQLKIAGWREEYNEVRTHSNLD